MLMEQDIVETAPSLGKTQQPNEKKWKVIAIISIIISICSICFGACGLLLPLQNPQSSPHEETQNGVILVEPLADIDQWAVADFAINNKTIYQASEDSHISDNQKDGWMKLLNELTIICHKRDSNIHPGNTAHITYTINMKNGDTYTITWLGNQHQVDITTPDGLTTEYQCYHS